MLNPISGTYKINVNYYSDKGNGPTTASLKVFVGNELKFSESYRFTSSDKNATSGLGEDSPSFWKAYELKIGSLEIISITTQTKSPQDNAIFTTHPDENLITVKLNVPEGVRDEDIKFDIEETQEKFKIDTSNLKANNNTLQFRATHKKLISKTNPRISKQLKYKIIAFTLDSNGRRDLASEPSFLVQDVRSRIRQEYVDKKELLGAAFKLEPPVYDTIIDESQYPIGPPFFFDDFSRNSDFGPNLAVIDRSRSIATQVQVQWGLPLRITSGWRNPRRNDSLRLSAINSVHQTGNAIDLNPFNKKRDWPAGVTTYKQAKNALHKTAINTFKNDPNYQVVFHGEGDNLHVHIEYDPK